MKERVRWIDISRGIAIVLVVMAHVISSYQETGMYKDSVAFAFIHQFIYSFVMPVFMIVSGYLVARGKRRGTKGQQVLQKLINYGIPYVIFSVVWVLMKTLMSGVTNSKISFTDLLWIPVFPISFMWFLYALMLMQIIQVFITTDSKVFKAIHLLLALAGYICRSYLNDALAGTRFSESFVNDILRTYVFFLIGVYLAETVINALHRYRYAATVIGGILMIGGNIVKFMGLFPASNTVNFLLSLAGSVFLVELSVIIGKCGLLEYLGKQSLPIYVLQGLAISSTRLLLTKLHMNDPFGIVPMIVCTVTGCLLPLCAYWLSTKIWKLEFCFYPGKFLKVCKPRARG